MRITIVGGGKVGAALAKDLMAEKHQITVIDPEESVVERITSSLDVICYVGNGASFSVLQEVGVDKCDLLIAVTASDELNMLACLSAHKLGAKHTIARVRNPEYSEQLYALKNDLGLSMAVNPEKAAAEEIARTLRFPAATGVELFARGRVELVSCRLPKGNVLDGKSLIDVRGKMGLHVLICAVDRGGELIIPNGTFVLREGDMIYLTGAPKEIFQAFRTTKLLATPVRNVMISGSGRITYYLYRELEKHKINIKIIEPSKEIAEDLADQLSDAVILRGDVSDHEFLLEEGIAKTDAFVALTDLDEANILSALYARQNNVPKVIAKIDRDNMKRMTGDLGIETAVSPHMVTANHILRYVRALADSESSANILSLYKILDGRAEVLEFVAEDDIPELTNVPLKDLPTKKNLLIACIVRGDEAIIPGGGDCILPGDTVLIVTSNHQLSSLDDIIEG